MKPALWRPLALPALLAALLSACAQAPVTPAPVVSAPAPARQAYADIVHTFAAEYGFNGVVLVGRGREVLALESTGVADAQMGRAMSPATRFETGSMSKWVAAIVVLRLVDQGRLALDAPITTYLPDYRADTGRQITLRHLMSHSSGVPNDVMAARKANRELMNRPIPLDEAVRRYASGNLQFAPGSAWDYSHANWLIVMAVAERVSGKPYAQLVRDELTGPLQLADSGIFLGDSADVTGMAKGYSALTPAPELRPNPVPPMLAMAGGYYTTAADQLKLMAGVLDGPLLSPASRKALMTTVMPDQHYALGGRVRTEVIAGQPREAAWEDGSNGGFRIVARRVLADGHTVVVLNNSSADHARLGLLADELMAQSYR